MKVIKRNRAVRLPQSRSAQDSSCIQGQVVGCLRTSPYRELAGVRCRIHRGVATLEGEVSSYYLKQIAQSIACRVSGVVRVLNQIHVRTAEEQRVFVAQKQQYYHDGRLNNGHPHVF